MVRIFPCYFCRNWLVVCMILMLLLSLTISVLIRLERINVGEVNFMISAPNNNNKCPNIPARFHVSAEPELYGKWDKADAYLLAGGSNLFPGKAAFHSVLIGGLKIFLSNRTTEAAGFIPIMNRTFADVSYRSSYCQDRRENLAGLIRQRVEAAGFTFQATGLCGGAGYPNKEKFKGRGDWRKCGQECAESKIMLSFERFQLGHHYLSEKLFLPLEHGAIPAYFGNGHSILDMLTVNRKAFLDRIEFSSDEAFADRIVDLLRHPEELQRMQQEQIFHDLEMAKKRILFIPHLENATQDWNPELYHALRENDKFKKFINATNVRIRSSGVNNVEIIKHVLNVSSIDYVRDPEACVDIEVHGCCFRRRRRR